MKVRQIWGDEPGCSETVSVLTCCLHGSTRTVVVAMAYYRTAVGDRTSRTAAYSTDVSSGLHSTRGISITFEA